MNYMCLDLKFLREKKKEIEHNFLCKILGKHEHMNFLLKKIHVFRTRADNKNFGGIKIMIIINQI